MGAVSSACGGRPFLDDGVALCGARGVSRMMSRLAGVEECLRRMGAGSVTRIGNRGSRTVSGAFLELVWHLHQWAFPWGSVGDVRAGPTVR
jgi:hypothetical protein